MTQESTHNKSYRLALKILRIYTQSELPDEVTNEVKTWLVSDSHQKEKEQALQEIWDNLETASQGDEKEAWKALQKRIGISQTQRFTIKRSTFFRVAAVVIPASLIIGTLYLTPNKGKPHPQIAQIPQSPQTTIITNNEVEHIILFDGTEVWVNKQSEFTYGENRETELKGEAFFKVKNVGNQKFKVKTGSVISTVIGTSFNIHAHEGINDITLSLYEGRLEIETPDTMLLMHEGEEWKIARGNYTIQTSRMLKSTMDWIKQPIIYERVSLQNIFIDLEKRYNTSITGANANILNDSLTVKFEQETSLEEIMGLLTLLSGKFQYKIESNKVHIY